MVALQYSSRRHRIENNISHKFFCQLLLLLLSGHKLFLFVSNLYLVVVWSVRARASAHVRCRKTTDADTNSNQIIRCLCAANIDFPCIWLGDESRRLRHGSNDHFLNKYKMYVT